MEYFMLFLTISPSRLTYSVVDAPADAVCGATGFPSSPPTVWVEGRRSNGRPRSYPMAAWNGPNRALDDVLPPVSAAPSQPRNGEITKNQSPTPVVR